MRAARHPALAGTTLHIERADEMDLMTSGVHQHVVGDDEAVRLPLADLRDLKLHAS
jgi:hypothetical protein